MAAKKQGATRDAASAGRRTCATMEHHSCLVQVDEAYRLNRREIESYCTMTSLRQRTEIVRIPVVVHILYNSNREDLSREQVESQILALNRDFRLRNSDRADIPEPFKDLAADMLIEFALAIRDPHGNPTGGITRTRTSLESFPYDRNDPLATQNLDRLVKYDEFGRGAWPRDEYLNLWVCTIQNGLLGYAQFPGGAASTDGVVIHNEAFGSGGLAKAPYDLGRTAVHEVGHWLNLLHIWGDDGGGCTGSDNVGDTPNQSGSNGSEVKKSDFPHISCQNAPYGDLFMNYMDYVDDETMVMFTKGQLQRVNSTLFGPRSPLARSPGLRAVETIRVSFPEELAVDPRRSILADPETGKPAQTVFDGVGWVPVDSTT